MHALDRARQRTARASLQASGRVAAGRTSGRRTGAARSRRPGSGQRPTPRPARSARARAPSIRSAGCGGSADRAGRPGTGGTGRTAPCRRRRGCRRAGCRGRAFIASIRSATWKATPSSVARARSAIDGRAGQAEDRPARRRLPVGRTQARSAPARRSTSIAGSDSSDSGLISDEAPIALRPSRNHCTAAPGDEHAPLEGILGRLTVRAWRRGS